MTSVECWFEGEPGMLEQYGPTISVQIGLDYNFHPTKARAPNLPATAVPALVDTGAGQSCIDSAPAEKLELPVVNRRTVAGVHGAQPVNIHIAQIYIPDLDFSRTGLFVGAHLLAGGQPHAALIGRDILRNFTMIYEGQTGAVRITKS